VAGWTEPAALAGKSQHWVITKFGIQAFVYEEIAMYNKELYYALRRIDTIDGQATSVGQVFVSRDGKTVLTGNFDIVTDSKAG
jgi:hypothetical protein